MEAKRSITQDLRLILFLSITGVILFLFLLSEKSSLEQTILKCKTLEKHILNARSIVLKNKELLSSYNNLPGSDVLRKKSLRTILMEAAKEVGISGRLEAINPTTDKKKSILKARVALRGVKVEEIVKFLLYLKNLQAGIKDKEASMRMLGYNVDRWRLDLLLEAPMVKGLKNGKKK